MMHRFKVDKLIRAKIPELLRAHHIVVSERTMGQEEYLIRLKDKLIEEQKVREAKDKKNLTEELADVLEVIHALILAHGLSYQKVEEARLTKKKEKEN